MLASGGKHQQSFGIRRDFVVFVQQQITQFFPQFRATWLTRVKGLNAFIRQKLLNKRQMRAFARSVYAV